MHSVTMGTGGGVGTGTNKLFNGSFVYQVIFAGFVGTGPGTCIILFVHISFII